MKTAVLHIGSPKTGTTHVQNVLNANRPLLEAQGVGYPGDDYCHHYLYFAAQRPTAEWPRLFREMSTEELQPRIESRLAAIARDLQGSLATYLLSNEYLFFADGEAIDRLLDFLRAYVDRVEVVVFVREPAGHFASTQQQLVKANHKLKHPRDFRYPFRAVIETWEARADAIRVLGYDPESDPVGDLAGIAGFTPEGFAQPEVRMNASIHVEQMWLLQKIQATFYRQLGDIDKPHLNMIQSLQPKGLTRPRLRPDVRGLVQASHAADLVWLHERFGVAFTEAGSEAEDAAAAPIPDQPGVFDLFDASEAIPDIYESWLIDTLLRHQARRTG